ncbi:hypothetical protein CDL60_00580 [Roseateles noduli]|nr:hypothetical protein CDL60_00580 [Roseateles noduli]
MTRKAQRELTKILQHIHSDKPLAAEKMAAEFERTFRLLALQPYMGTIGAVERTRETFVKGVYRVVYQVGSSVLNVLRVIHTARRWPPGRRTGS